MVVLVAVIIVMDVLINVILVKAERLGLVIA